jgi:hypothetical protein
LIGKHVEKRFGGKYFVGIITDVGADNEMHEKIWHVRYGDSDSEDCTEADLQKILCDDFNEFEALLWKKNHLAESVHCTAVTK